MDHPQISARELELMTHALGIENKRTRPYRNYYDAGEPIGTWESLASRGLATFKDKPPESIYAGRWYFVSPAGREALKALGYWTKERP